MSFLAKFVNANKAVCRLLDRALPSVLSVDGNLDYQKRLVWEHLSEGQVIVDVGSGKNPLLSPQEKANLKCTVVGLDKSAKELAAAPAGSYDGTIETDITNYVGNNEADIVVCQSLLEHVPDTAAALRSIATLLRPGGELVLFVPCRNAVFARLNLILPEAWKRKILRTIFPSTGDKQGFRSFYHLCTPAKIQHAAEAAGLECVEEKIYAMSWYFSFFFPLYFIWRFWSVLVHVFGVKGACESFAMVLRKAP
jgi:2-polyprenyl-3-methyl-5-hydroxy-6-metoxy-1,4-benzoquinol methylase